MDYVNQVGRMIDREKAYAKKEGKECVMVHSGSLLVLAGRSYLPYHFPDIILQIVGGELRSLARSRDRSLWRFRWKPTFPRRAVR